MAPARERPLHFGAWGGQSGSAKVYEHAAGEAGPSGARRSQATARCDLLFARHTMTARFSILLNEGPDSVQGPCGPCGPVCDSRAKTPRMGIDRNALADGGAHEG
jgi:hypothetical protein